ncbi:hypothetical protein EV426DRAFT_713973 [Tirmania nivea]|nr:hypothetical protein EV426DRAFT_713973 [Tirmania nivea]
MCRHICSSKHFFWGGKHRTPHFYNVPTPPIHYVRHCDSRSSSDMAVLRGSFSCCSITAGIPQGQIRNLQSNAKARGWQPGTPLTTAHVADRRRSGQPVKVTQRVEKAVVEAVTNDRYGREKTLIRLEDIQDDAWNHIPPNDQIIYVDTPPARERSQGRGREGNRGGRERGRAGDRGGDRAGDQAGGRGRGQNNSQPPKTWKATRTSKIQSKISPTIDIEQYGGPREGSS